MNSPAPLVAEKPLVHPPREHFPNLGIVPELRFRTILVPVDCTERSRPLLAAAASIAQRLDADLVLLHIHGPLTYAPAHNSPEQFRHCQDARDKSAKARLREAVRAFDGDRKIQAARLLTVSGDFERGICDVAVEIDADLILISTHAYCGLEHFFMGSKAEWIVRHAPCPVMVVPVRDGG